MRAIVSEDIEKGGDDKHKESRRKLKAALLKSGVDLTDEVMIAHKL